MKKIKKVLSLLLGGAMAASVMTGVTADVFADCGFMVGLQTEGYEEFDDYGVLNRWLWPSGVNKADDFQVGVYKSFRNDMGTILLLANVHQNWLMIEPADGVDKADLQEIYQKYQEELDYDKAFLTESAYYNAYFQDGSDVFLFYDYLDAEGNCTADPDAIPDHSVLIQEMCKEMYEADLIVRAEYIPYFVGYLIEDCLGSLDFYIGNVTASAEEIQAVVSEVNEDITVQKLNTESLRYHVDDMESSDTVWAAIGAVKTAYPDAEISVSDDGLDNSGVGYVEIINLLDGLVKPDGTACGDINLDGKISVLDAIMLSKANSQMIQLNETQTAAADCNGDGAVDSEDIHLLLCYLTEKVDALPVTTS